MGGSERCGHCDKPVGNNDKICPYCYAPLIDHIAVLKADQRRTRLFVIIGAVSVAVFGVFVVNGLSGPTQSYPLKDARAVRAVETYRAERLPDKAGQYPLLKREVITSRNDGLSFVPMITNEQAAESVFDGEISDFNDISEHVIVVALGTRGEVVKADKILWVRLKEGKHKGVIGAIGTDFVTLTGR